MVSEKSSKKEEKKEKVNLEAGKVFTKEFIKTIVLITGLIIFIRFFVIQPFIVKGGSMEPNFHDNNYIFVNELSYRFTDPKRGDVVIFKHPEKECTEFVNKSFINRIFLQGPCTNFIKRVIGLPGETVVIKDGKVIIKNTGNPDGFTLSESYIPASDNFKLRGNISKTLGKDEYFVLGDNRQPNASLDSREWGALPENHITGKALIRVLPFNDFGFIRHPKY
ncbi:signal peptidase I [candidate division WS5 bacterium]|uniref:Signal peptidase I n=1 Tax=candidate division WS5 bacterium TaxID=2093353 RepID=A0A419DEA7_9BACT|nr:MAG: signal peptidase I [candidate division WS5 bacterium]